MNKASILIIDSDKESGQRFSRCLVQAGHQVEILLKPKEYAQRLQDKNWHLIIIDDCLSVMSESKLFEEIKKEYPEIPVILISANGGVRRAVTAIQQGAEDYLLKSVEDELICQCVTKVLHHSFSHKRGVKVNSTPSNQHTIIAASKVMHQLLDTCRKVAPSSATILLQGESGTGKELVARFIHTHSGRVDKPFVSMNCAALPENLAESELFGYERGAFTGAMQRKRGKFELAHNSTLLLDEISEMPLSLQAKLLRVLQEKQIDPVGGSRPKHVDTRIIATTNRDLSQMVAKGEFRHDLYYRIRVIPLLIPPLSERRQDIPLLVSHFQKKYCPAGRHPQPQFNDQAMVQLTAWDWPGNVRELENTVERAMLISNGSSIGPEYLFLEKAPLERNTAADAMVGMTVKALERKLIEQTLQHVNNNRSHAAKMLGISIRTLRNKLNEYRQATSIT